MAQKLTGYTCINSLDGSGTTTQDCTYVYSDDSQMIPTNVQEYGLSIINFLVIVFLFVLPYILIFMILRRVENDKKDTNNPINKPDSDDKK